MAELDVHRDYLQAEWRRAVAAPLSRRKALLVAMLVDAYVDRLFAADPEAEDVLAFRQRLAAASPALGTIMALAAQREGVRLVTEAVAVPIADYGALAVEDFMVSLYNDHSIQRLRIVLPAGDRLDMHEMLAEAMETLGDMTDRLNNPTG